ncbi:helix-hairpin-helix domain-containing protein [Bacillus mojavensis]|uniref:helix-hairpin-helix domain-containing protein n=1 Tax=Bacillus mojavensis TaxID=72360 RepID=UPI002DB8A78A|nr:helix-hairpin-helix domain-containing protein [Bacillus mojavensis]MEC1733828.1 helix-hairpin-helix domain-containing protein [Bacillus mojavensis]MED1006966.1 helix-hairpin-helix domain-containing protein [Bacillus mojavensis]
MNWLNQHKMIIMSVAFAAVLIAVLCLFFFIGHNKEPVKQVISNEKDNAEVKQEVTKDKAEKNIVIDIKGAVKHPGVYEMHAGDRVSQAIEKAGGIGEKADETQVNLAELLQDGTVVYIPSEGEEEPQQAAGGAVQSSTGKEALVNINTATLEDLQNISGVGPSKAEAIIAYREENGRFQEIEDITKVSGIGEKSFEKIKSSITVK